HGLRLSVPIAVCRRSRALVSANRAPTPRPPIINHRGSSPDRPKPHSKCGNGPTRPVTRISNPAQGWAQFATFGEKGGLASSRCPATARRTRRGAMSSPPRRSEKQAFSSAAHGVQAVKEEGLKGEQEEDKSRNRAPARE